MPDAAAHLHHAIDYVEISVRDVSAGGPLVVLYSRDLDATLAAVRPAGGEIVRRPFSFPGGRRFHFRDPSGNELAVWAAA